METLFTSQNILFVIGLLGTLFGIYHYFKNPQIDSEKKDALLAQQVQWQKEGNDRRFTEMQTNIKEAFALGQNHIHTVDTKVDNLTKTVQEMSKEITRLATIIEERMPKK